MTSDPVHQLLPWYVSGTLDRSEAALFEEHLAGCSACREELETLIALRHGIEQHGDQYFEDHPSTAALAAVLGEDVEPLPEPIASAVRSHVKICATCAEEARWLAGAEVAGGTGPVRDASALSGSGLEGSARAASSLRSPAPGGTQIPAGRASTLLPWSLAVAAMLALAVALTGPWSARRLGSVTPGDVVLPSVRSSRHQTIRVPANRASFQVRFPVILEPSDFPVIVEIVDERGEVKLRVDGITSQDLVMGEVGIVIEKAMLPDGPYVGRIRGASQPPAEATLYPFRVTAIPHK